jgi:Fur family peroxide stress response transcriptional regulator
MINREIQDFIDKCKEVKLSVTPQRIIIYKELLGNKSHPSPEDFYNAIKEDNPTISFATVYNTLETFEKYGFIKKVTPLHNKVRYDPVVEPHHHLVCVKCGKIIDVEPGEIDEIEIPGKVVGKNMYLDYSLRINIVCTECLDKENKNNTN